MFGWRLARIDDGCRGFQMTRPVEGSRTIECRALCWYEVLWYWKKIRRHKVLNPCVKED